MTRLIGATRLVLLLSLPSYLMLFAAAPLFGESAETEDNGSTVQISGQELFEHEWQINDPLSPDGDGLGPVFNAQSCVACHNQGGVGGGGGTKHNVDLLTVIPTGSQKNRSQVLLRITTRIHAELQSQTSVTVHKFGLGAGYSNYRASLLTATDHPILRLPARNGLSRRSLKVKRRETDGDSFIDVGPVLFQWTQRNTPALFGAGLIDAIEPEVLGQLAIKQRESFPEVNGVSVGRFGWRGQVTTLSEFVAGACANELGLQTAQHPQPVSPLDPDAVSKAKVAASIRGQAKISHFGLANEAAEKPTEISHVDMQPAQLEAMVAFVSALPPPKQLQPRNNAHAKAIQRGSKAFSRARCNACHVQQVGHVEHVYSDLMLHDMGDSLSNDIGGSLSDGESFSVGSYHGGSVGSQKEPETWRTPPLWGVRYSAPYLHDGRASSLRDAIMLHAGESRKSAQLFADLDSKSQTDLIAFVKSIGVP